MRRGNSFDRDYDPEMNMGNQNIAPPPGVKTARSRTQMSGMSRIMASLNPKVMVLVMFCALIPILFTAAGISSTVVFILLCTAFMLMFAVYLAKWVMNKNEGNHEMQEIAEAIRDGAEGYFSTQYGVIGKLSLLLCGVIYAIYYFRDVTESQAAKGITSSTTAFWTALSFILGAFCSAVAGYTGMWVAVRANIRVSAGARKSMREALVIALRAGGFASLIVVGMTVMGVAILYTIMYSIFVNSSIAADPTEVPLLLVGYGFGASFVALFAQVGGGIYTKAADVGADLVGKVECGIPEDDPRNPAVIADLVGDNVGDCAARGADLFESIAAEIISAMILGGSMCRESGITDTTGFILFPLVIHTLDLVVSTIGIMSVSAHSKRSKEDPYDVMKAGYKVTIITAMIGFTISCRYLLYTDAAPSAWKYFTMCGFVGICCAYCFVWISQYYTDYKFTPVKKVADACKTGHATNVIAGVSLGMESTAMPVIVISVGLVLAYSLGKASGLSDTDGNPTGGLFGTAVSTMGMLSTAAYVLAMDIFGPISDNAGGIVEMTQQPESVRATTDLLDAVGNTTKATTKGYAIGSAALASFLLFSAFMDEVSTFTGIPFKQVDIAIPEVFVAGLLGSMLVYLFSAWTCAAVGNSAQEVVKEVRRQFREKPGIMTFQEKPDYGRCVSIVASSALSEMIKPGLLAVSAPCIVGVAFRMFGSYTNQELLGAKCVVGMLMFATVAGILMALFLNTAGGAWDNAKKYVELTGEKGSEVHKASITGDTVGDPFKDTAGPSIHVLIKMLATLSLIMAPLFIG